MDPLEMVLLLAFVAAAGVGFGYWLRSRERRQRVVTLYEVQREEPRLRGQA